MNKDRGKVRSGSPDRHLEPLWTYRGTVSRLFPHGAVETPERDGISMVEAVFLGHFLDHYPRSVVAVEAAAGPGLSTFWLASHPGVATVLSVYAASPASKAVGDPDVFAAVLAEHPDERNKLRVLKGGIGGAIPEKGPSGEEGLVVLLMDFGNREDVEAALTEVFRLDPRVIVFLCGCRGERSPFVQAGVADFLESSRGMRGFRLVADLGPALAGSGMAIVYASEMASETDAVLSQVAREFSRVLDPLRLLGREEELTATVTELNRRLSEAARREESLAGEHRALLKEVRSRLRNRTFRLQRRISELEAQIEQLRALQSSRRYRVADALAERALRLPALRKLARRSAPQTRGD